MPSDLSQHPWWDWDTGGQRVGTQCSLQPALDTSPLGTVLPQVAWTRAQAPGHLSRYTCSARDLISYFSLSLYLVVFLPVSAVTPLGKDCEITESTWGAMNMVEWGYRAEITAYAVLSVMLGGTQVSSWFSWT